MGILCTTRVQGGTAQVSWGSSALIATSLLFIEPQVTKYQINTLVRFFYSMKKGDLKNKYIYEERILGCAILFNVYTILSQRVSNTKHFTS